MSPTPAGNTNATPITARDLEYRWPGGDTVLRFPDIDLARGEQLFLQGASGSGKSTLLGLFAGLTLATKGTLEVLGQPMAQRRRRSRDQLRADSLGVIFQQFNLVPYLNAIDNVLLPCRLSRTRAQHCHGHKPVEDAQALLSDLDITPDIWRRPVTMLSVGQQQRVAAARALIGSPRLILADEPTSALDSDNRDRFVSLLLGECRKAGAALVFVSHDRALAGAFDHTLELGSQA